MFLIFYTIALIFVFIYIKDIFNILKYIFNLFMPFILGLCIAFVLNVLINVMENKWFKKLKISKKSKRFISLILSLGIVIGFVILLLFLIVPNLQDTIAIFVDNIPTYYTNIQETLEKFNIDEEIITQILDVVKELGTTASDYIKNNSNKVIETTLGVASNVVSSFINIIIAVVFAIYYLAQKEKINGQFAKLVNAYLPKKAVDKIYEIGHLSNKTFAKFISGQCLEALIIGVLCFIGMILLKLPYASTISVLVGSTALIPVFGAFIGTAIGAFLIFMISPVKALIFVIFIIILQQFEGNLIYPKVVGKSVGLPGIWVFMAVTIGASIDGVLGMLLSVPIVSILYSILATNVNLRLKKDK